jgi:hypothetical protein
MKVVPTLTAKAMQAAAARTKVPPELDVPSAAAGNSDR